MSFFDDVLTTIFGGTDESAQAAQLSANQQAAQRINTTSGQARSDVLDLFPQAQEARNQGFQAALDVLGQSIPAQLQTFQQGNLGAQQNLLSGLPQFTNAILGNQIDFSGLQPTAINAPTGFLQQNLPFGAQPQGAQPNLTPQDIASFSQLLGGGGNFSQAAPTGGRDGGDGRNIGGLSSGGGGANIGNLLSGFNFSAEELDTAQKLGGLLGFAGPAGSLAGFALGQAARVAANEAFPGQEPIGFFADILQPDIAFGSPFEQLQLGAQQEAERQEAEQLALSQARAESERLANLQRQVTFGASGSGSGGDIRDRGRTGGGGSATGTGLSSRGGGGTSFF